MPAKWDATFPRTATTASQSRVSQPPRETLAKHRPASVHNRQIRASRVTIERDAQRDTPFGTHRTVMETRASPIRHVTPRPLDSVPKCDATRHLLARLAQFVPTNLRV